MEGRKIEVEEPQSTAHGLANVRYLSQGQNRLSRVRSGLALVPQCWVIGWKKLGEAQPQINTMLHLKVHSWELSINYTP